MRDLTSAHWGVYEVRREAGKAAGLVALVEDEDPSPIGLAMWEAYQAPQRVLRPAVRRSWLEHGPGAAPQRRGREDFVEVSWERALELVAAELARVRQTHGNEAIFGGSYGWSSAGRFHHAQSQVHRFLNSMGGYVRHVDSYSLGAARVAMPHIVGHGMEELMASHHGWDVLERNTRLLVAFGGIPAKNAQVSGGGVSQHRVRPALARLAAAGCRLVNVSPVNDNFDAPAGCVEWIPIRPGTDTAAMLAMAAELLRAGRHDEAFVRRYCAGFDEWSAYLLGHADGVVKDAEWAAPITGIAAARLRALAFELAATRSLVNVSWSLQRADHGEQPYWAAVGLAALIGQIGLPGGGFGVGYGAINLMGSPDARVPLPTLPQGSNAVRAFIPVARITDMLLGPGESFSYNGAQHRYPDIQLIYWAGGNPFHHHQDLNRLAQAWRSKPATVVVHEQVWTATARMADIVLPATSTLERDDIGASTRDALLVAMKAQLPPPGQGRDDYAIFSALAQCLGCADTFTEGRDVHGWLRHLWNEAAERAGAAGTALPDFDRFWAAGEHRMASPARPVVMLEGFRQDPEAHALPTPSGRIELHSGRVAGFGLDDCPGHAVWREPDEWLGSALTRRFPLHLVSDQPHTKLHSQLDFSSLSRANKIAGREPVYLHPADARERGVGDGDVVRVFNDRGACLAGVRVSEQLMPGVARMATGAWWDPSPDAADALDRHGNPNVLTRDAGASQLSQGCAAQSCLVQIEPWRGQVPDMQAFDLPPLQGR